MKLLVFDIGSNSIRTAKLSDEENVEPSIRSKHVYTTRLAEGLAESGGLSQARMRQSLFVIRSICQESLPHGFECYAYATSAVRDANNKREFINAVEDIIGVGRLSVLSGAEEAGFAQRGADPSGKRTILDIGGGSTQIVRAGSRESWPIGCVRAKDLAPYTELKPIAEVLRPILSGLFGTPEHDERPDTKTLAGSRRSAKDILLGVGGTITTLALLCDGAMTFSEWRGEKEIQFLDLCATLQTLSNMGDEARAAIPLLKDRHDVILQGGVILMYLMELLHSTRIGATLSDGLDGYAMHLYQTLTHR
jgi:exopolyphosphatase/guanosine-5'-triphosphate,3'-diphosphate pyrophosphatase